MMTIGGLSDSKIDFNHYITCSIDELHNQISTLFSDQNHIEYHVELVSINQIQNYRHFECEIEIKMDQKYTFSYKSTGRDPIRAFFLCLRKARGGLTKNWDDYYFLKKKIYSPEKAA